MSEVISRRSIIYDILFDTSKGEADVKNINRGVKELDQSSSRLDNTIKKTGQSMAESYGNQKIADTIIATKQALSDIKKESVELAKINIQFNRELKEQEALLKSIGSSWSKETPIIKKQIGQLKEAIQDNNFALKEMKVAEGEARDALKELGIASKDMAISTGLWGKAVTILNKTLGINNPLLTSQRTLTDGATLAQKAWAVAVGTGTKAMKLFRIALASTGIGLVVVAVGTLVANFDKLVGFIQKTFPALDNLKDKINGFVAATVESFLIIGDIIGAFFTDGLGAAIDAAEEAGKRLEGAYHKGFMNGQKENEIKRLNALKDEFHRRIAVLEVQGQDTFKLRRDQANAELKAARLEYGATSKEAKDAATVLFIIQEEERLKRQKADREAAELRRRAFGEEVEILRATAASIDPIEIPIKIAPKADDIDIINQTTASVIRSQQIIEEGNLALAESYSNSTAIMTGALSSLYADGSKASVAFAQIQILANTAAAISGGIALATKAKTPVEFFAVSVSIAAAIISAISQSNQVLAEAKAAKAVPSFEEGTEYLQRNGRPMGRDTIPIMADEGEAIIPADQNKKYPGLARAFINDNLDNYIRQNYEIPSMSVDKNGELHIDYSNTYRKQTKIMEGTNMLNKKMVRLLSSVDRKLTTNKFNHWYGRS